MVFYHLINMALGSYILMKPNYLSLFRIFFFIEINMYPLIWLYWIFPKSFDVVPHRRLLGKLSLYGICCHPTFGTDRVQRPSGCCRRVQSPECKILSGVPQGTVLGPLLFLLHINDLPSVVTSQIRLFADDCLIYRPIRSSADCEALQRELDYLERWSNAQDMESSMQKVRLCPSPV